MPAIPTSAFADALRDLDHDELVRFVSALWEADGWETSVEGSVVLATQDETTERLLVVPPARFQRLRSAPQTDGQIDRVIVPGAATDDPPLPRDTPSAPIVDADALRNRLLYAIDSERANELADESLGLSLRGEQWESQDPALTRVKRRVSGTVGPAEKPVSRRAALGTLGVSLLASGAWVFTNRRGDTPDESDEFGNETISTPEQSVPETATFSFSVEDDVVTITHNGGDPVAAGQLVIQSDGLVIASETTWDALSTAGPENIVTEGDSVQVEASRAFEITILLDREGGEERLSEFSYGDLQTNDVEFEEPPTASFAFDYEFDSRRVVINYIRGSPLMAGDIVLRGADFGAAPAYRWSEESGYDEESPVRPGDRLLLMFSDPTVTVKVVWEGDDGETKLLDQFYGPDRPKNEAFDGVPDDRYGSAGTGFAGELSIGEYPAANWTFESEQGFGSSIAIQQGVMVVAGRDGTVFALDPVDGVQLWRTTLQGSTGGTPVVGDGRIFLRQFSREQSGLIALDLFDGSILWTVEVPQQQIGRPVYYDGSVLTATTRGPATTSAVYSFDATNARSNWSTTVDEFIFPAYLAVSDGTVYMTSTDAVVALGADGGSPQWRFGQPDDFTGNFWGPIVVDGMLLVFLLGDERTRIHSLNLDGTERWHTDRFRRPSTLPVTGNGRVFVPLSGSDLVAYSLDTGAKDWTFFTTNSITALTATSEFVYAAEPDTIHAIHPLAGDEDGSNVQPSESFKSIIAVQNRLFTAGNDVISYEGLSQDED